MTDAKVKSDDIRKPKRKKRKDTFVHEDLADIDALIEDAVFEETGNEITIPAPSLIDATLAALARDNFGAFRKYIRPEMTTGWWVAEVADMLQEFYEDWVAGKRPVLVIEAPPQHGKSWSATDFIAWVAGKMPHKKTIFASYSEDLGTRTNLDVQRIMKSTRYRNVFARTQIDLHGWQCNTSLIEYAGFPGSFRNTTVNGQINGQELHLGVIDDPVKGRKEAQSAQMREATWTWFADDFMSRFANDGALLVIMTRWHVDDVVGRMNQRLPGVKVLRYPAIAEMDELYRKKGGALFPKLKSLDFLLNSRKKVLTKASWESLYQQNPIVVGGGLFPIERLRVLPIFDKKQINYSVRGWDKAATQDGGDYSVGVLMHAMKDGSFVISNVERGQWSVADRERRIQSCADDDRATYGWNYQVMLEQEPGSGGKESAQRTITSLAGHSAHAERVTGDKELRAEPFAAQVQNNNVWLVAGMWIQEYKDELEAFPSGKHDDQVDASSVAFNRLTSSLTYNLEAMAS